jgi:hypothetical protein
MNGNWYDTAQICINGHIINWMSIDKPEYNKHFCEKCGAVTITNCQHCNAIIKGYRYAGRFTMEEFNKSIVEKLHSIPDVALTYNTSLKRPSFCPDCGKPYPWTEAKLKAAKELSDEFENLSPEERNLLKNNLDDIVRDTPETPVAATRLKRLISKIGKPAAGALKDIIVDIASEAAKKVIWPT